MKLCECGCGQPAPIAKINDRSTNRVKGQPMKFIRGHNQRGIKRPDIAAIMRGRPSPGWKGDDATKQSIHEWLNNHYPRKGICEECGKKTNTDYAFKSHNIPYTRNRTDYRELCRSCHLKSDRKKG